MTTIDQQDREGSVQSPTDVQLLARLAQVIGPMSQRMISLERRVAALEGDAPDSAELLKIEAAVERFVEQMTALVERARTQ